MKIFQVIFELQFDRVVQDESIPICVKPMSYANQTDYDAIEKSFVLHGKEFHDVYCEVGDEGVNLYPTVVYEEGSRFCNVDPKEFENVMNRGCQNSKHIET